MEELAAQGYEKKEQEILKAAHEMGGAADMREIERVLLLRAVDEHWMDHIDAMDQLRQGIGLQALGQKDPVVAYRNAGFDMFDEMVRGIREKTVRSLYHVALTTGAPKREQLAKPLRPLGTAPCPGSLPGPAPRSAGTILALAAAAKNIRTAAAGINSQSNHYYIKEVRTLVQLDEYRQKLEATAQKLKEAGESL